MLIIGSLELSINSYLIIGGAISLIVICYYMYIDIVNGVDISIVRIIENIAEGLMMGLSWMITIPILTISKIILNLLVCFYFINEEEEEEDDEI